MVLHNLELLRYLQHMSGAVLTPLATIRKSRGLSLGDLSKMVDYDRGGLSRIERGIARPRPELANRLVTAFEGKITRDQILFPEEYPEPTQKKPVRSVPGKKSVRSAQLQEAR